MNKYENCKTEDVTPTWYTIIPILLAGHINFHDQNNHQELCKNEKEITRMARIADRGNDVIKDIQNRLEAITTEQEKMKTTHLYYTTSRWKELNAQAQILGAIIKDLKPIS